MPSPYDLRHVFRTYLNYELPFGKGKAYLEYRAVVVVGPHPVVLHRDLAAAPSFNVGQQKHSKTIPPDFVVGHHYLVTVPDQDAQRVVPTTVVRDHSVGVD